MNKSSGGAGRIVGSFIDTKSGTLVTVRAKANESDSEAWRRVTADHPERKEETREAS